MKLVTDYKCIFESKAEIWRFALTLKGESEQTGFAVSNPETAETLLDMLDDASGCHFDANTGEMSFSFDYVAGEDEDEDEDEKDADEIAEADGKADEAEESDAEVNEASKAA